MSPKEIFDFQVSSQHKETYLGHWMSFLRIAVNISPQTMPPSPLRQPHASLLVDGVSKFKGLYLPALIFLSNYFRSVLGYLLLVFVTDLKTLFRLCICFLLSSVSFISSKMQASAAIHTCRWRLRALVSRSRWHHVAFAVQLRAKTLLPAYSNCSFSIFVLAQGTATSCHVCYYRAETRFSPLSQLTSQLLWLLPTAEWAQAITFIQCACFSH